MEEPVKAASLSGWSLKGRKKMGHSYIFPRGSSLSALPRPIYLLLVLLALSRRAAGSDVIRIGGLFDPEDERQEVAFRYAVDAINSDRTLLAHARLSAQIEVIPPNDSFRGSRKVCSLLKSGVAAIFGPQSGQTSAHVQSICDALEVPHIENRWDFRLTRDAYSVNLYPHPSTLSKAYMDVLMTLRWRKFYVIYENNDGLVRVQELLKNETWHITLRQLPVTDDYRPMLKDAKKAGVTYVVLDLERDKIFTVLKQAQQIGMMTSYHNYFITSLDLHTVDLEDFRHGGTNITCLRLVDPDNPLVQRVIQDWVFGELRYGRTVDAPTTSLEKSNLTFLKTEVALMYDAVRLFAKALDDLDRSRHIDVTPLDCDGDNAWVHGNSLVNYMKWVQVNGLTGLIKFDTEGFRRDVTLDIVELTKDGLTRVGKWDPANGANYTRTYSEVQQGIVESLQNKTLVITSVLAAPYTMLRETSEQMTGNHRYEGFCVDLIHEISEILGFNYTIKIADDGQHGKFDKKLGRWNGMIGELLDQKADLAIGDLTITYEREQEVDFTMPWMNLGISILYRKPTKKPPNLFSFLSPLSLDVWLYMATAYLGVSLLLFVLARCFTRLGAWRHGKRGPASSRLADDGGSNEGVTFSSRKREAEVSERAVSTRIVAGMWWFFTLIMISSYTANLAAFLTVERMESPIESAEDLAMQTKIKYGSLYGGSTWNFFSTSKLPIYQRMFSFMESQNPTVYTKSNEEGVKRVQKGDGQYAYMMESSSIEYITERYCDLTQVGGPLDSKSYGIALPPGSPYTNAISEAILNLQEEGILQALKKRWWQQKKGGGKCVCSPDESKSSSKANELGLNNVGGVFVVLLAGMGLASVVAVCEFVWKSRKLATEEHASVWTEMSKELKFALSCDASSKPVRKKLPEHENGPSYLSMNNTFGSTFTTSQYSFSSKDPVS
ncbi:glutamate receptor ionotropic, kainate 2-like isoform X4 [Portunus trituberculatus]|uniref:glutamate receptor ionotropic, kainate 2-like isoform X4 n=1 Tax=Portunus trituberculatus TaxID=210409 RepID=UPI001E1CB999|nr:glutamate receptor ionotropic, kainate 2-like isoform X4 [Portunus trituberculatus]